LHNTKISKVDRGEHNILSNFVFKLNCPTLKRDQLTLNDDDDDDYDDDDDEIMKSFTMCTP
jgi:hypothetical protein